jgi:hypothetical protein
MGAKYSGAIFPIERNLESVFPILPGLYGNNHKPPHQHLLYKLDEGGNDKQPI